MTKPAESFAYIETTLPQGLTISAYRAGRPRPVRGWRRIMRAARGSASSS